MIWVFLVFFALVLAEPKMVRVTPIHGKDIRWFDNKGFKPDSSPGSFMVPEDQIKTLKAVKHIIRDDTPVDREGYETNAQISAEIANLAASHPDWISFRDIGSSENGQPLRAIRFERVVADEPTLNPRPLLRLIGNMHGDEVVSREILVRFIRHLVSYADSSASIRGILANTTIEILPTMNPDGFDLGTRVNKNGFDLNRAFPDHYEGWECGHGCAPKEVLDVMAWMNADPPTMLANFHGGSVVCNYPRDGNELHQTRLLSLTPDNYLLREVCRAYSEGNPSMFGNYLFRDGIVNGAYWYVLYGGLQDWVYDTFGVPSVTIEVSSVKWPDIDAINGKYWAENVGALTQFAKKTVQGVFGSVTDANNGAPLNARFDFAMQDRGVPFFAKNGQFHRVLTKGSHDILVSADGYSSRQYHFEVEDGKPFILNPKLTKTA